jgi:hypothetical protein
MRVLVEEAMKVPWADPSLRYQRQRLALSDTSDGSPEPNYSWFA